MRAVAVQACATALVAGWLSIASAASAATAPHYSVQQTATFVCEAANSMGGRSLLDAMFAHEATIVAERVAAQASRGEADAQAVEAAEARRSEAVLLMLKTPPATLDRLPLPRQGQVSIEDVQSELVIRDKAPMVIVRGVLRNAGDKRARIPGLSVHAIDADGFVLMSRPFLRAKPELDSRTAIPFELVVPEPPGFTIGMEVTFLSLSQRSPGPCPTNFSRSEALAVLGAKGKDVEEFTREPGDVSPLEVTGRVPVPLVGEGAPYISAAVLEKSYKASIHNISNVMGSRAGTSAAGSMIPTSAWEQFFRAGKARNATLFAERVRLEAAQGKRTPAEVEAAELKRQSAVRRFLTPPMPDFPTRGERAVERLADLERRGLSADEVIARMRELRE